jgi:hypothetical protein
MYPHLALSKALRDKGRNGVVHGPYVLEAHELYIGFFHYQLL